MSGARTSDGTYTTKYMVALANPVLELHKEKTKLIKVLVVEDSSVLRELLTWILASDPGILVVGFASYGEEAIDAVTHYRPDVTAVIIHMPNMDGLKVVRRIMETKPVPIVIVSGSMDPNENINIFRALEIGAMAVMRRPNGIGEPSYETDVIRLLETIKLVSEVKVVRRWPQKHGETILPLDKPVRVAAEISAKIIALGASTGGPSVLQTILSRLPRDFPLPILIVQHITSGFTVSFAQWLAQSCALPVHVASHGEFMLPGHVYIAPDECQMKVGRVGEIILTQDAPENGLRPSVSYLFRSLAAVYEREAVACLLTGMGRDGAEELRLLKDMGAVTIAQNKESSVVHGMPGLAIKIDAVKYILAPDKIADMLTTLANKLNTRQ